ncbi:Choline-phosphate cytidylyltransferase B [Grifola frondosa]|uniref:choline-phosphate cytidylyltransferase n=1 Tax=Grifola frondosa TaxID=5627 RepID=A0A1C7MD19_GRIFR|nr:Choline-phosphate cytidylyltransferase B [Grifola frondosa]
MVGVFADDLCERYNSPTPMRHVDRCEVVRHCRWVDEVVADAPWAMEEKFLRAKQIDYVAIDEGSSIDPACDRERLKGYDLVKSLPGKAIPTRRTNISTPMERIVDPYPSPESARGTIKGVPTPSSLDKRLQARQRRTQKRYPRNQCSKNPRSMSLE